MTKTYKLTIRTQCCELYHKYEEHEIDLRVYANLEPIVGTGEYAISLWLNPAMTADPGVLNVEVVEED